jgi:hypothetical protein
MVTPPPHAECLRRPARGVGSPTRAPAASLCHLVENWPSCAVFVPATPSPPPLHDSSHGVRGEQGHVRREGGSGADAEGRRHHGRRERGAGTHRRGGWRRGRCVRAPASAWTLACNASVPATGRLASALEAVLPRAGTVETAPAAQVARASSTAAWRPHALPLAAPCLCTSLLACAHRGRRSGTWFTRGWHLTPAAVAARLTTPVMALERVPADIRKDGGVARMSDPSMIQKIKAAVTIPVMAKVCGLWKGATGTRQVHVCRRPAAPQGHLARVACSQLHVSTAVAACPLTLTRCCCV